MKGLKHGFFISLALIITLGIGYRGLGGFLHLEVVEQEVGIYTFIASTGDTESHAMELAQQSITGYTIIYIPFTGGMLKFHPALDVLEKSVAGKDIHDIGKMSIYHDLYTDRRSSASENDAGIIVDPEDVAKLDKKFPEYKIMTIPAGKKMVINFPYKGPGSCMIGHIRGTKAMHKYLKSQHNEYAAVIELYNKKDDTISYISEVQK